MLNDYKMNEQEINKIMENITKDGNLCIVREVLRQQESKVCCGEAMQEGFNYTNDQEYKSYTCLKCGSFITIVKGQLDAEELENLKEDEII